MIVMKQIKHVLTLFLIILAVPAFAAPQYIEGQDYTRLPSDMRSEPAIAELSANNANKVQLLLFFNFGCSACARFEPTFERWESKQNNSKLVIYREPVAFEDDWEDLAKLYYVTQDLKPHKNLNEKIFKAIHEQDLKLSHESEMEEFFVSQGYNVEDFKKAYNSYEVETQAKRADALAKAYDINQTPTIVINGVDAMYMLTVQQAGGDKEKMMKIADYLIATEIKKLK
jgi:thiol:disulfide interchange protein DsbA